MTTITNYENYTPATYNPFYEVERTPAFAEVNGSKVPVGNDALINVSTGDVVGLVSPRYSLVENKKVAELFDDVFNGYNILSVKDHINGTKNRWKREIIFDDDELVFDVGNKGDIVRTCVEISNGYDSKTAITFIVKGWRQICSNGMMGWGKIHHQSVTHNKANIVEEIQGMFSRNLNKFAKNITIWENWMNEEFDKKDFEDFINSRKEGDLSNRQKIATIDMFENILCEYGDEENRWGAFNVLTAIATHHTKARSGSNLFSNAHRRYERVIKQFYGYNKSDTVAISQ